MKVVISGYGKMGHMVEAVLQRRGIELVCASEDVCAIPKEVADYSTVADGAPSLYCHWKPSPDRMGLEFDKCEKAENLLEWLIFLIQYFIEPNGYLLSGEIVIEYNVGMSAYVNGKIISMDWYRNTIVMEDNKIIN